MSARFEILDIPGGGAHATVAFVLDRSNGKRRALKVLREEFGSEGAEAKRVRDEGRILQRLQHRGLPRVFEVVELDGRQVLLMEALEGVTLARLMRTGGALSDRRVTSIIRQVSEVVAFVYGSETAPGVPARLVHRDLNLSNLMLLADGTVKVLDFGLARAEFADRESYTMFSLRGTPGYTAPEGLRAVADNPGLDVYGLGICGLALLGGHVPVLSNQAARHGPDVEQMVTFLMEKGASGPLVRLLSSMCAFERTRRPSMSDVHAKLLQMPQADLPAFATQAVKTAVDKRPVSDPVLHHAYPQLAFLEEVAIGHDVDTPPSERADALARRFLDRPDWADRVQDLKWLLSRNPAWTVEPWLAVLEPLDASWWRPGVRRPTADQIVVALSVLSNRGGPAVLKRAQSLVKHRDRRVASVASRLTRGDVVPLIT